MGKLDNMVGNKYGRLLVEERLVNDATGKPSRKMRAKCDCGNETVADGYSILSGATTSCGCFHKELLGERSREDLTGQIFYDLTVLRMTNERRDGKVVFECRCICGNIVYVEGHKLKTGNTKSCGCRRSRFDSPHLIDLTGMRFGMLFVKNREENTKGGQARWLCECDCGEQFVITGTRLRSVVVSCPKCAIEINAQKRSFDLTGLMFGRWHVDSQADVPRGKGTYWNVTCACGSKSVVSANALLSGNSMSCGCYGAEQRMKAITNDLTGMHFGYLDVIERSGSYNGKAAWKCRCVCGNEKVVVGNYLTSGHVKSCGCLSNKMVSESKIKHGLANTRLYGIWHNMIARCLDEKSNAYNDYGGRGISVCDEWMDLCAFYEWSMTSGYRDDLTIDRIDVNGNYEASNCRWVGWDIQSTNKRNTIYVDYHGKKISLAQLCRENGSMDATVVRRRIELGWDVRDWFIPVGTKRKHKKDRKNCNLLLSK